MKKDLSELRLQSKEDRRIKGGHLWIYSNEIDNHSTPLKNFQPGQLVKVLNQQNELLGIGYVNPNTLLCARILTRNEEEINENFFSQRIKTAQQLRDSIFAKPFYRLIYGESDGLPGLVIDRYDNTFVGQITTAGMEQLKPLLETALQKNFPNSHLLWRNDSSARQREELPIYVEVGYGQPAEKIKLEENNTQFQTQIAHGQKTGWFYDHRENRARLQRYVPNKKVLDVFCYIGGWGIQAAKLGAASVTCIDSSAVALTQLQENIKLNALPETKFRIVQEDAFVALKNLQQAGEKFSVIILDPPAFIKKRKDLQEGLIAYQRLNELALRLLNENGILISCSCSLHLSAELLQDIIRRASVKTQRPVQIIERTYQAPDHPVHPAIPETAYLKAFFCRVMPSS